MMTIHLADHVYNMATRKAERSGKTLERYVSDLIIDDPPPPDGDESDDKMVTGRRNNARIRGRGRTIFLGDRVVETLVMRPS